MVSASRIAGRWLLIIAVASFLAGLAADQTTGEQQTQAAAEQKADPPPPPPPPKSLAADKPKPYQPACGRPKNQGERDTCEAIRANDLSAKNLFWVRIGTAAVMLSLFFTGWAAIAAAQAARAAKSSVEHAEKDAAEQSVRFERQLEIATKSADAATSSANAMMSIERAWLFLHEAQLVGLHPFPKEGLVEMPLIYLTFANEGRGPAWPKRSCERFFMVDSLDDLPAEPEYSQWIKTPGSFEIVQGKTWGIAVPYADGVLPIEDRRKVHRGQAFFVVYGAVEYDDAFGRGHITRYCWLWHKNNDPNRDESAFRHGGPDAYNQHT